MAVLPVRIVAGRYLLKRPIGRGGMGVVWLAQDRLLGREVAVKEVTFPETLPEDERESLRARVLREARAAARLNHPGVITIYDVLSEQGRAFIVMELITAPSLDELVARQGPLSPEHVARIGLQIASALEAAHRAGVVHRDVKPANVMVAEDGGVWLGDFGVAHLQGDPRLTASGIIVGSPWYMAPEQASDGEIGPATDLWGLGATMYYAVEGEAPFERGGTLATLTAVVNEPPRPPERAGALQPVLESLLAKDPAARPGLRQTRIRLARVAGAGRELRGRPAAAPVDLFTPAAGDRSPTAEQGREAPAKTWAPAEQAREASPEAGAPAEQAPPEPREPAEQATSEPRERAQQATPKAWKLVEQAPAQVWEPATSPAGPPSAEEAPRAPGAAARGGERRGRRRWMVALSALAGVAVLAVVAILLVPALSGPRRDNSASGTTVTTATRATTTPTTAPPATTAPPKGGAATTTATQRQPSTSPPAGESTVPKGWTTFSNPSGGYTVASPPGWSRSTGLARHGTRFRDGAGRSIKVESAHPAQVPANGDPMPGWIQNERYWSARLPGYQRIGSVHQGTYHGMRAAIWEYRYSPNGRLTHGLDISFVGPNATWGYSVLALIPEDRWEESQPLLRSFEQAFTPRS
jgi:predicted Ser/Thr protein kinase